jgi:hypothetical protein
MMVGDRFCADACAAENSQAASTIRYALNTIYPVPNEERMAPATGGLATETIVRVTSTSRAGSG